MMGEPTVLQESLFYSFNLDRHVPMDHLLRSIDRFVDLSGVREHLRPYYSSVGRPSVDPELMIRMLIVGYCFGIVSVRPQPPCVASVRSFCCEAWTPRMRLRLWQPQWQLRCSGSRSWASVVASMMLRFGRWLWSRQASLAVVCRTWLGGTASAPA